MRQEHSMLQVHGRLQQSSAVRERNSLKLLCVMENTLANKVAFAAGHSFEDVHHLLGGVQLVNLCRGTLAPRTLASPAAFLLFFRKTCFFYHNFTYFCNRKPKGNGGVASPPFRSFRKSRFPIGFLFSKLSKKSSLSSFFGFSFFLLFSRFSVSPVSLSKTMQRYNFILNYNTVFQKKHHFFYKKFSTMELYLDPPFCKCSEAKETEPMERKTPMGNRRPS